MAVDCRECRYFNTCVLERDKPECEAFKSGPVILIDYQRSQRRKAHIRELEAILKRHEAEILRLTKLREDEPHKLEAELARYQKALDSLTIAGGGSNMHGDPEYQAEWVKDRHTRYGELVKKKVLRAKELEAENAALREALGAAYDLLEGPSPKAGCSELCEKARALIDAALKKEKKEDELCRY